MIDFSKHKLITDTFVSVIRAKVLESYELCENKYGSTNRVNFIIDRTRGKTFVTGDFVDCIFNKPFNVDKDKKPDPYYLTSKLDGTVKCMKFDPEGTQKRIKEYIQEFKTGEIFGEEDIKKIDEAIEFLNYCIEKADEYRLDEHMYLYWCHNELPNCLDHEDVIIEYKYDYSFLVVFEAWKEICKRINKELK